MTLTYKTDDSFFTLVLPPFTYYGFVVKKWFMQTNNSRFRYIRDIELEREFSNLEMIDTVYPGIKTVGIIFNPWARMLHGYNTLCAMKKNKDTSYLDLNILELGSFTKFIHSLPNMQSVEPYNFTLATPMSRWYRYQNDSEVRNVDYLLKAEDLAEEFKTLQEYFCCTEPLAIIDPLLEYKKSYNKTTRAIVAEMFKEDIEQFGYKF